MNWDKRRHYYPPIILINIHLAGIIGLTSDLKPLFLWMTPLSLILSAGLLFFIHKSFSLRFTIFAFSIFLLGFFVEVLGVKTGLVFGNYFYGDTLGYMMFDVPLIMGLNWLVLTYSTGCFLNRFELNLITKCSLGATILVLLDLLIEQIAIRNDFWHWSGGVIPIQNYLAWWIISFVFLLLLFFTLGKVTNRLSFLFLAVQFLFFGGLLLFQ